MTSDPKQVQGGNEPEHQDAGAGDPAPEIERRLAAIRERFPDRFSPEQIEEIRNRVARSVALGVSLSGRLFPNATGPNFDPRATADD